MNFLFNGQVYSFHVPSDKRKLVNWLSKHYTVALNGTRINWRKFKKKKLRAIYISYRIRTEVPNEIQTKEKKETDPQEEVQLEFNF